MKAQESGVLKVFFGVKTFEYDFALHEKNRVAMLLALQDIHPRLGKKLEGEVAAAADDAAKARVLFSGMFERGDNNVQKGRFAQALAARIEESVLEIVVPGYIHDAIKHVA
jgi:putative ATP-dependent endonuclease of OLD family